MDEILKGYRYSLKNMRGQLHIILFNPPPQNELAQLYHKLVALPNHPVIYLFTAEEYVPQHIPNISEVM